MELTKVTSYHDTKKKMLHMEYYVDHNRHKQGVSKTYYKNRRLAYLGNFKDNMYHGEYKEWFQNGQLRYHLIYEDNDKHGEYKEWDFRGHFVSHRYYFQRTDITKEVIERTNGNPVLIKLTYGLQSLPRKGKSND